MNERRLSIGGRVVAAASEAVEIGWELFKSWRAWPFDLVFELQERLRNRLRRS